MFWLRFSSWHNYTIGSHFNRDGEADEGAELGQLVDNRVIGVALRRRCVACDLLHGVKDRRRVKVLQPRHDFKQRLAWWWECAGSSGRQSTHSAARQAGRRRRQRR